MRLMRYWLVRYWTVACDVGSAVRSSNPGSPGAITLTKHL